MIVAACVCAFSPLVASSKWLQIEATSSRQPDTASKFINFDIDEV